MEKIIGEYRTWTNAMQWTIWKLRSNHFFALILSTFFPENAGIRRAKVFASQISHINSISTKRIFILSAYFVFYANALKDFQEELKIPLMLSHIRLIIIIKYNFPTTERILMKWEKIGYSFGSNPSLLHSGTTFLPYSFPNMNIFSSYFPEWRGIFLKRFRF